MRHTKLYVDLGYHESTLIAVIKDDALLAVAEVPPLKEFKDIVDMVVKWVRDFNMPYNSVVSRGNPAFERAVVKELDRMGYQK